MEQIRTGNDNERLTIQSGEAIFIDQFMLGNPQFIERARVGDEELRRAVYDYGGAVVPLSEGEYRVFREPRAMMIVVHSVDDGGRLPFREEDGLLDDGRLRSGAENAGRVFVDTRCVVMVDRGELMEPEFLREYLRYRNRGEDKEARDFVRNRGGAVRYGFSRLGDELGVYFVDQGRSVALWPDVTGEEQLDRSSPRE